MTTQPLQIRRRPILRLEDQLSPGKMAEVWERWHSTTESATISASTSSFPPATPRLGSADHGYNKDGNITSGSARQSSGKRWGFLATKKLKDPLTATAEPLPKGIVTRHEIAKKKSAKLLRRKPAKHKSTPDLRLCPEDLGKVNAYYAPVPKLPAPRLPSTPCPLTAASNKAFEDLRPRIIGSSETAIYFTVDPSWSRSQEDVTMIFL